MCGIAGYANRPTDPGLSEAMLKALRHRGPESNGVYANPRATLGHARLSIIDVAGGQQPIANEDESVWIICNGEVFDYQAQRQELIDKGHRFRTYSDSEVILHLYEEYGPEGFTQLNGQYAFAIWDDKRQQLVLCRDRFGICPLFYTFVQDRFYFASEIKALLAVPEIHAEPNLQAFESIWTQWTPTPGQTCFNGIHELIPAHYAVLKPGQTDLKLMRYWELDFTPRDWRFEEAVEAFEALLDDSVRIRLQADVPVGAYLSGGLDSSMTTAYGRHHADVLHTFSISFENPDYDESVEQSRVADFFGTQHHKLFVDREQLAEALPLMIFHAEAPQLRAGPIPMYLLSSSVRAHGFKVIITGEGADEFLCGYNLFTETAVRRFMARSPDSTMRRALVRRLYGYLPNRDQLQKGLEMSFQQGLEQASDPLFSHLLRWKKTATLQSYFTPEVRAQFSPTALQARIEAALPPGFNGWHWLARAQALEVKTFMSPYLLAAQGDRAAMGHSVEGRFPFLDHRLVDLVNSFPPSFKLRSLQRDKHILRHLAETRLPPEIAHRPKVPYRAPIAEIFKARAFQELAHSLTTQELSETGLFIPSAVQKLLNKVQASKSVGEMEAMALFGIMTTQMWHTEFIKGRAASPALI